MSNQTNASKISDFSMTYTDLFSELVSFHVGFINRVFKHHAQPLDSTFETFATLPAMQQLKIIQSLQGAVETAQWCMKELAVKDSLDLESEKQCLLRFMDRMGVNLSDNDQLGLFDEDDVIEVFDSEGVQVYRSWSYFKFSSYSIAELSVYDWNVLYERPTTIINTLMSTMPSLFMGPPEVHKYKIPDYIVRQRMGAKKDILFRMKYALPLQQDGNTVAFISTGTTKFIMDAPEADKNPVAFI